MKCDDCGIEIGGQNKYYDRIMKKQISRNRIEQSTFQVGKLKLCFGCFKLFKERGWLCIPYSSGKLTEQVQIYFDGCYISLPEDDWIEFDKQGAAGILKQNLLDKGIDIIYTEEEK